MDDDNMALVDLDGGKHEVHQLHPILHRQAQASR